MTDRNHSFTGTKGKGTLMGRGIVMTGVVGAALLALAACGSSSSAAPDAGSSSSAPIRVAYFNPVATNTYTAAYMKGLEAAAAELGATVTMFDAKFDPTTQINQVQDATASGRYDVFAMVPLNNAGLVPVVAQAREKGIEVVSLLTTVGTDIASLESSVPGVITVGLELGKNGERIAGLIVDACASKNPCKVAYMPGDSKQASDQLRTNGLKMVLSAHENIELVAEQPGGFDATTGLATAQNILTAHPDLDVLAAASGQPIAGAMQARDKAGLTDQVLLVSNAGSVEDVEGIRAGTIFGAPVALPQTAARLGLDLAVKALRGEQVTTANDESQLSPVGPDLTLESLSTPAGAAFTGEYSAS